jgi:hypothetical protein
MFLFILVALIVLLAVIKRPRVIRARFSAISLDAMRRRRHAHIQNVMSFFLDDDVITLILAYDRTAIVSGDSNLLITDDGCCFSADLKSHMILPFPVESVAESTIRGAGSYWLVEYLNKLDLTLTPVNVAARMGTLARILRCSVVSVDTRAVLVRWNGIHAIFYEVDALAPGSHRVAWYVLPRREGYTQVAVSGAWVFVLASDMTLHKLLRTERPHMKADLRNVQQIVSLAHSCLALTRTGRLMRLDPTGRWTIIDHGVSSVFAQNVHSAADELGVVYNDQPDTVVVKTVGAGYLF